MKKSTIRRLQRLQEGVNAGSHEAREASQAEIRRMTGSSARPPGTARPSPREEVPPAVASVAGAKSKIDEYREKMSGVIYRRDEHRTASNHGAVPQGETRLVLVWQACVYAREFPPEACTILLVRVGGGEPYEILIPGDTAFMIDGGCFPERALLRAAMSRRMQPSVQESFIGRITAPKLGGGVMQLGEGTIDLPPDPDRMAGQPTRAGSTWSDGRAGASPMGASWQAPVPPPAPSPSPYGQPWEPAFAALQRSIEALASKIDRAPSAPSHDPLIAEAYRIAAEAQKSGHESLANFVTKLLDRVNAPAPPVVQAPALPAVDPMTQMKSAFEFVDGILDRAERRMELRNPPREEKEEKEDAFGVHQVGDTTVVTQGGKVDPVTTAFVNLHGEVRGQIKNAITKRMGGASPPKGSGGGTNLAGKG